MKKCRLCNGEKFKTVIDFGVCPLVNNLLEKGEEAEAYLLKVVQCQDCSFVQTENPLKGEDIYQKKDYLYFTGEMPTTSEYFGDYARQILARLPEFVVEIGSNDGTMLKHFAGRAMALGVDPATNVVVRALKKVPTISAFFNERLGKTIAKEWGRADAIIANNCIAHIDDLEGVMKGVDNLISERGVLAIECNYWGAMVKNTNYALIYHDHFSYFSLKNWYDYLPKFDLELFDAFITPAQGGSLRLFASRKGTSSLSDRARDILKEETETKLASYETCQSYEQAVVREVAKLKETIQKIKANGKTIAGYGAAAKGLSALHLAGVENELDYFVDDSPAKQGKFTPEGKKPVISRAEAKLPDYFLITAPNYEKVIYDKEADFRRNGGAFVTLDSRILK